MATATETAPAPAIEAPAPPSGIEGDTLYRLSLDVYERMVDLGLLTKYDKAVLLDGLLVNKMTRGPLHVTCAYKTIKALEKVLPHGWFPRKEDPIRLPDGPRGLDSSPEPDIVVVRGTIDDYGIRHPNPDEIALVIEVAHGSVSGDRKGLGRYAWASIPTVWIINLVDDTVEVCTRPSGRADANAPGYANREVKHVGDAISIVIDGEPRGLVAVADILG